MSALVSCAFFPKKVHFIQVIKVTGINLPVTSFSNWKSGQAACHSKARKEARWVERKVCFILDVINCRAGRADICPKADHPSQPWTSRGKNFYRRGGWRGLRAETARSALTVFLKLVLCSLVSVVFNNYRSSSVPGWVCLRFFEASSRTWGGLCRGYSLAISWWGFVSTGQLKDVAQSLVSSPRGGTKGPWLCLMTRLLLLGLLWRFSLVSVPSHCSD